MRRFVRILIVFLAFVAGLVIAGGLYARWQVRASLPLVDGSAVVPGLSGSVRVERDHLGIPTITGESREDVTRALGFVHAQERFFQMDLQRRQPAGELSALVGTLAVDADISARVHRFRDVARRALALATPAYRSALEAYAEGVNAGVNALGAPPFDYLVLRTTPEPWRAEDSILTVLAMFNTLQGRQALFERTLGAIHDTIPEPMFRFLTTVGSNWDTPVSGAGIERPPIPGPDVFDLSRVRLSHAREEGRDFSPGREPGTNGPTLDDEQVVLGSNNWAVDGAHSASGSALVANDMHLDIGVPIIWYRASLAFPDSRQPGALERINGVTLPGLPTMVVGSNGHVAWGFTNSGGDWSDLVRIEPDARDRSQYLTPDGPRPFDVITENIIVKGSEPEALRIRKTIWGPVVWTDALGRDYAQRWIAHDAETLSSDITKPERARTVDDLLDAFAGIGIPNQNVTAGDSSGRIGWTIGGAIPRRIGHDGLTPQSWADGTHRWDGFLPASDFPRIVSPEGGRIWTANAPVVDGAMLATIGEGGYADGIRARLIRDRLLKMERATPADMLSVQLEDSALYLERWRALILDTLQAQLPQYGGPGLQSRPQNPDRAEFSRLVETTWTGRASPDSVAYRLVRQFRTVFVRRVMTTLTAAATRVDPEFDYARSLRGEGPVWQIVTERPAHLLEPQFKTWNDMILASVDRAIADLQQVGPTLADRSWGEFNRGLVRHPLSGGIPWLGQYLNMPSDPLPGDVYTPRAHSPRTGPSERMVVSPGHEQDGILHLPTGQSGHPLSPHYGDQYRAWLYGEPTPFLPGPTVSTLTLTSR